MPYLAAADASVGTLSDNLLFAAVLAYSVAMLAFAVDFAASRRVAVPTAAASADELLAAERRVLVGAGLGAGAGYADPPATSPTPTGEEAPARRRGLGIGRLAVALTGFGWALHVGSAVTRGLAAHRVPWGNMYEFSSMVSLAAVSAFLVVVARERVRHLGAFVLLPVVLYLGLAATVLYVPAAPLVPALSSYWIKIHVVAAITASGTFMVGAVVTVLYLLRARYEDRVAAGRPVGVAAVTGPLPSAASLDRTAYRVIAFAFPVWTFAVIAGAIWAEAAWGRYWGWDPKETWSFITWVIYAGYLHARSTAGWKGRRAAVIALFGFAALMLDYFAVNIWIVGLHSYAK